MINQYMITKDLEVQLAGYERNQVIKGLSNSLRQATTIRYLYCSFPNCTVIMQFTVSQAFTNRT